MTGSWFCVIPPLHLHLTVCCLPFSSVVYQLFLSLSVRLNFSIAHVQEVLSLCDLISSPLFLLSLTSFTHSSVTRGVVEQPERERDNKTEAEEERACENREREKH